MHTRGRPDPHGRSPAACPAPSVSFISSSHTAPFLPAPPSAASPCSPTPAAGAGTPNHPYCTGLPCTPAACPAASALPLPSGAQPVPPQTPCSALVAQAGKGAGGQLGRGAEALEEARSPARSLRERLQRALLSSSPRGAFGTGAGTGPPVAPEAALGEVGSGVGDPLCSSSRASGQVGEAGATRAADGGGECVLGGGTGGMAGGVSCALVQQCGGQSATGANPQCAAHDVGRESRGPPAAAHDAKAILLGSRRELLKLRRQRQKQQLRQQQQQGEERGQGEGRRSRIRRCAAGHQHTAQQLGMPPSSADSDTNECVKRQRLAGDHATPGGAPPGSGGRRNPTNDALPANRLRAAGSGRRRLPCTTAADPEATAAACGGDGEGTGAAYHAQRQHKQQLIREQPQVAAGDAADSGFDGKGCGVPEGTGSAVAAGGAAGAAGAGCGSPWDAEADPRVCVPGWVPPASPWGLLEEALYDSPWRLMVACVLLNRTTSRQVRGVLGPLWAAYPTAEAMAAADPGRLSELLRPLGLHRRRAESLRRFSHEFLTKQWRCPTELHAIGRYAADAYLIFCRGQWRDVQERRQWVHAVQDRSSVWEAGHSTPCHRTCYCRLPLVHCAPTAWWSHSCLPQPDDKDLRLYRDWLEATGGQGSGLERDSLAALLPGPAEVEASKEDGGAGEAQTSGEQMEGDREQL